MRKISVCIPTYNRLELTLKSFEKIKADERVDEIVIVDDCSTDGSFEYLKLALKYESKVKLFKNETNLDCYKNKFTAISKASNDYCILLDSDNEIDTDYLDRIYEQQWDTKIIFQPSFAQPLFDFREYEGLTITKENVAQYISRPMFDTMLNAMNFFVNRNEYLKAWDGTIDPVTADSIHFNYCWLINGGKINVVPNLSYQHLVHSGSHYQNNVARTPSGFYESVIERLKQLKQW